MRTCSVIVDMSKDMAEKFHQLCRVCKLKQLFSEFPDRRGFAPAQYPQRVQIETP